VALQGNMDPSVLYGSPARIREEVQQILTDFGTHNGHVFNLGHGILPQTPPENAAAMIDTVKQFSAAR
ncbi:MAG: uroporphyrinogen decarboxylase family protein, partial [Panacagrimonas sp.]